MIQSPSLTVHLVDDDDDLRHALAQTLILAGLTVEPHERAEPLLRRLARDTPGVIVTDIRMPGMDGLTLARQVRTLDPELPVILITGHGDVEMAVRALRDGVFDFLTKPCGADRLVPAVLRALDQRRLVLENRRLTELVAAPPSDERLLGRSPVMQDLRDTIRLAARGDVDVLIQGEAGTGKEAAARELHRLSDRARHPFVTIDCAGHSDEALEAALHGIARGAAGGRLTGGQVRAAGAGTVLLDEVEALSPAFQVRLERLLDRRALPQPQHEPNPVPARFVATSRIDLIDAVHAGLFRADLYYRLSTVRLELPTLRRRPEDIELLFRHFLIEGARRRGIRPPELTPSTLARLRDHDWPGNVRELAQFAERHLLGLTGDDAGPDRDLTLADRTSAFERQLLIEALTATRGDVPHALTVLGLARKTFYDKLTRHGLKAADYRR